MFLETSLFFISHVYINKLMNESGFKGKYDRTFFQFDGKDYLFLSASIICMLKILCT